MRWASILSEAWRDVVSGASRALLWAVIIAMATGGAFAAELVQLKSLYTASDEYVSKGASINVFKAAGHINPTACEALNQVPGIRAAGAIRRVEDKVTLTPLPSAPVPLAEVTPHFPDILKAQTAPVTGVIASEQVHAYTQVNPGQELDTHQGKIPVSGVYSYPEDGRVPGYGYLLLSPTTKGGGFDECWADIWPESPEKTALLHTTLMSSTGEERQTPQLSQLNPTLGSSFQALTLYQHRITRFLPAALGIIAFSLGYALVRIRRLDYAAALHARIPRHDMYLVIIAQTLIWLLPTLAVLELLAISMNTLIIGNPDQTALLLTNRIILIIPIAIITGLSIAWQLTREQHLFQYYKTR